MKASRFSDAQKAFILKQGADGIPVADICRKAEISQAAYFNWKKKYDGMLPPDMRNRCSGATLPDLVAEAEVGGWTTPSLRAYWTPTLECL